VREKITTSQPLSDYKDDKNKEREERHERPS